MKVDFVSNSLGSLMGVERLRKPRAVQKEAKTGKTDISKEVRQMAQKKQAMDPDRLREIRRRIREGFYDRDDVLHEVAERILSDSRFRDLLKSPRIDKSV